MSEIPEKKLKISKIPEETYNISSGLAIIMECPVCMDTLYAPIIQCSNGHNVCGGCSKGIACCPVCKGQLIETRNLIAEQISQDILGTPCENSDSGCTARYPFGPSLSKHQLTCPLRPFLCQFCRNKVPFQSIVTHCREKHGIPNINPSGAAINIHSKMKTYFAALIEAQGEYFWIWHIIKNSIVICGVSLGGKADGNFQFRIESKGHKDSSLVYSGPVHSVDAHPSILCISPCDKCVCASTQLFEGGGSVVVTVSKKQ